MFPHVIIGGGKHEIFGSSIFLVFLNKGHCNMAELANVNSEDVSLLNAINHRMM